MCELSRNLKILYLSYTSFTEVCNKGRKDHFLKQWGVDGFFDEIHFLQQPSKREGKNEPVPGIVTHDTSVYYPNSRFFHTLGFGRLLKKVVYIVEENDIDIVQAMTPYLPALVGVFVKKITGVPFVLYLLNDYDYSLRSQEKNSLERMIGEAIERFAISQATKIFVLSPYLKKYAIDHGVSSKDITIIPFGLDIEKYQKEKSEGSETREDLGIKENELMILFVGRLVSQKNPLLLLKIYKRVKKEDTRFKLVIAGDGSLKTEMEEFSKKNKLNDVHFLGYVSHKKVESLISAADIFVFPTLHEGFGKVLIEAQAGGLPIVTTNIPHLKGIVKNKDALKFTPGNIRKAAEYILSLRDEKLRREMAQKSLESSERYSLEERYKKLQKEYLNILD